MLAVLTLLVGCTSAPEAETPPIQRPSLLKTTGSYGVTTKDLAEVAKSGINLVVNGGGLKTAAAHRLRVVDSAPQARLYKAFCPQGKGSCKRTPTRSALDALNNNVRTVISQRVGSQYRPAGYLILDDHFADFRPGLEGVAKTIRAADPGAPLICSFYLMVPRVGFPADARRSLALFKESLVNYSPRWCDAASIYAYGAFSSTPTPHRLNWSMGSVLNPALQMLQDRGWTPGKHSLIGVTQSFGYWPRTQAQSRPLRQPEYLRAPSPKALETQVAAFCRAGAGAIWAYAWDDRSSGAVTQLHNSPPLRAALKRATARCWSQSD